jgi:mono/diheme cytochrome c family protein
MRKTVIALLFCLIPNIVNAQSQEVETTPDFSKSVMQDPAYIESGKQVWDGQCRHCHGNSAYPGKAPKLKPSGYQPDFVYDRVTNGFRKMPGWKTIFSEKQRVGVTAYIMSDTFSP